MNRLVKEVGGPLMSIIRCFQIVCVCVWNLKSHKNSNAVLYKYASNYT